MGVVYEAERESLKAHVALKVLHSRCADGSLYRARFRNEARSAARMHHTNIVQVFDFGEHEGILYYAMQYISGQGLDRVLRDVRRLREQRPSGRSNPAMRQRWRRRSTRAGISRDRPHPARLTWRTPSP